MIKESVMGPIESFYDSDRVLETYYSLFFRGGALGAPEFCGDLADFELPAAGLFHGKGGRNGRPNAMLP